MMNLFETLKAALLEARKARNAATAASLSTLIGEAETLSKAGKGDLSDAVVVTIIKKFLKNLDESIKVASEHGNHTVVGRMHDEKKLYEQFLPKQLNVTELTAVIDSMIVDGVLDVGDAMKRLKANHAGTYNGAEASTILKQRFTK